PRLRVNDSKTTFTSRKRKRVVTGLSLTSDGKLSVGRTKKRHIKSLVFKVLNASVTEDEIAYLKGYLAFARSVEPGFVERVMAKYGADNIRRIEALATVARKPARS